MVPFRVRDVGSCNGGSVSNCHSLCRHHTWRYVYYVRASHIIFTYGVGNLDEGIVVEAQYSEVVEVSEVCWEVSDEVVGKVKSA